MMYYYKPLILVFRFITQSTEMAMRGNRKVYNERFVMNERHDRLSLGNTSQLHFSQITYISNIQSCTTQFTCFLGC